MWAEKREITPLQKQKTTSPLKSPDMGKAAIARKLGDAEAVRAREQAMKWAADIFGDDAPKKRETMILSESQKNLWYTQTILEVLENWGYRVDTDWVIYNPFKEKIGSSEDYAMIEVKDSGRISYVFFTPQDRITEVENTNDGWIKISRSQKGPFFIKVLTRP
jgi:hypothetical protein